MDRRTFLIRVGGTVVGTLAISLVAACGSDDDPADGGGGSGNINVSVEFVQGHGHSFSLNRNDLTAGTAIQFTLTGSHDHDLDLTGSEVDELLAGTAVTKDSSSTNAHTHEVTLTP